MSLKALSKEDLTRVLAYAGLVLVAFELVSRTTYLGHQPL
jgi:hypothetical protein